MSALSMGSKGTSTKDFREEIWKRFCSALLRGHNLNISLHPSPPAPSLSCASPGACLFQPSCTWCMTLRIFPQDPSFFILLEYRVIQPCPCALASVCPAIKELPLEGRGGYKCDTKVSCPTKYFSTHFY